LKAERAGALDPEAIGAVDPSDQVGEILRMPEHLRDALWRVESAGLAPFEAAGGLIVAGMGGSAIGGLLAVAALGDRASRPLAVARGYELPPWSTPETAVLCSSYSGDTEETLACYDAAAALGAPRVVVTTGGALAEAARADGVPVIPVPAGFQPRAAVAYMTVAALEVAAACGAAPSVRSEIDVAAAHAEQLVVEWGPDASEDSAAKALALGIRNSVVQIAGAGLTAPVAYRWKTQMNENAKVPAFAHELPELDHNELVGWSDAGEFGRFSAVFLDDVGLHPRTRRRIELTRALVTPTAAGTFVVSSRGESPTERVLSLVLLGDLVSAYLAVLRGVDPGPVEALQRLKDELART
jgi:glucose/mannose-6-phosphate isomerase